MTNQERDDIRAQAFEEAALVALDTLVMHGDHYAAYMAPSNDGIVIADAIRKLKHGS